MIMTAFVGVCAILKIKILICQIKQGWRTKKRKNFETNFADINAAFFAIQISSSLHNYVNKRRKKEE